MSNIERKYRTSKTISIIAICICFIGIAIAAIHLHYTAVNGYDTGLAIALLLCIIAVLFSNLAIFLANKRKYKNTTK